MFAPTTRILIADDMITMRKLVKKSLTDMGFSLFEEAADGQLAWIKLNEQPDIGLIVSDWNMPNSTGLDFLKRVRSDAKFKSLPFLLLTAEADGVQVKEALIAGVDGYVVKPYTTVSLKDQIEKIYKKKSAS